VMPALAGASEMSYRRFLVFNVLGGLIWGSGVTLLGYFAGSSFATVAQSVGRGSAALLIIVAVAGTLTWRHRRRRARRDTGGAVIGA
jgi:membrane-associated protein